MKRENILKTLSVAVPLVLNPVYADSDGSSRTSIDEVIFESAKAPTFTTQQEQNLKKVDQFKNDKKRNRSFVNGKGDVVFTYGAQQANVVCSVLNVCDIELQAGEVVSSVNVGDPSRWNIEPAVSGYGELSTQHVLIRPLDVGLRTNMLIATDRRVYRIDLVSSENKYYPHVSFSYPEDLAAKFAQQQLLAKKDQEHNSITVDPQNNAKTYLGNLNFNYEVTGNVSWKPVRIYDDKRKTIIEMPQDLEYAKAPALMLLAEEGGFFSDEKTEIINYRLQGNRYIVDGIFDTAILTMGLDKNQQRVMIKRVK